MRATITGGGGDNGKCTIEVEVDGTADVEVSGDRGRIVTLSGQPADWRRLQCSAPLPRNPSDFRFQGIDGRGRAQLIREPGQNRGVAVVRIEDSKGGREGYTFDLEWRGGSDPGFPGYDDNRRNDDRRYDGRPNDRRYNRNDDRYSDNDNRNNSNFISITCSSDDMRRHYCDADTRGGVRLLRQRSDADCRQGSTWGYDRRGIWVDRGCRADFEVRGR
jgi:hypothetical protein